MEVTGFYPFPLAEFICPLFLLLVELNAVPVSLNFCLEEASGVSLVLRLLTVP